MRKAMTDASLVIPAGCVVLAVSAYLFGVPGTLGLLSILVATAIVVLIGHEHHYQEIGQITRTGRNLQP